MPAIVVAEYQREEGNHKLFVEEVYPLPQAHKVFPKKVLVRMPVEEFNATRMEAVKELMHDHPGPTTLSFAVEYPDRVVFIKAEERLNVKVCTDFMEKLHEFFPPDRVKVSLPTGINLREKPERTFRKTG